MFRHRYNKGPNGRDRGLRGFTISYKSITTSFSEDRPNKATFELPESIKVNDINPFLLALCNPIDSIFELSDFPKVPESRPLIELTALEPDGEILNLENYGGFSKHRIGRLANDNVLTQREKDLLTQLINHEAFSKENLSLLCVFFTKEISPLFKNMFDQSISINKQKTILINSFRVQKLLYSLHDYILVKNWYVAPKPFDDLEKVDKTSEKKEFSKKPYFWVNRYFDYMIPDTYNINVKSPRLYGFAETRGTLSAMQNTLLAKVLSQVASLPKFSDCIIKDLDIEAAHLNIAAILLGPQSEVARIVKEKGFWVNLGNKYLPLFSDFQLNQAKFKELYKKTLYTILNGGSLTGPSLKEEVNNLLS